MDNEFQRQYKVIAQTPYCQDFLLFLRGMVRELADVRTPIGDDDSIEMRKEMVRYLQNALDRVERIRKNDNNPSMSPTDEMEEN